MPGKTATIKLTHAQLANIAAALSARETRLYERLRDCNGESEADLTHGMIYDTSNAYAVVTKAMNECKKTREEGRVVR